MSLSVRDIFALRSEGRVEEAYRAILPLYKEHHGKYTTLCMFWCAVDMAKHYLSMAAGDAPAVLSVSSSPFDPVSEAHKIFLSLQRMLPQMEEYDKHSSSPSHAARVAVDNLANMLSSFSPNSNSATLDNSLL